MSEDLHMDDTAALVSKHFNVATQHHRGISRQMLEKLLSEEIAYLLQYQMEKLLHILYSIDVKEKLVKELFIQNDAKVIAPGLAKLVVDRELEKVITRMKYPQTNHGN
jgi:hypothetical protein